MKNLLIASLFSLVTMVSFGQEQIPTDTLFIDQLGNKEYFKKYRDNYLFKYVKLTDGSVLEVGDEIRFGKPVGGNRVAQSSTGFSSSSVSTAEAYSTMVVGRLGLSVMGGMQWLPSSGIIGLKQNIMEIKKSRIILGTDRAFATVLNVEQAFKIGELINPKAPMTSEQALAELKKAKDKLDLGLITQQQFDSLKVVLSKIIQ